MARSIASNRIEEFECEQMNMNVCMNIWMLYGWLIFYHIKGFSIETLQLFFQYGSTPYFFSVF